MSYLSVISLNDAKDYLRIDSNLNDDNSRIQSMIAASLGIVEKETNILVYNRDKDYTFLDGLVRVYDFPINSLETPTDAKRQKKTLYSNYTANVEDGTTLTLNVGYQNKNDVPAELVEIALNIVKHFYYETETDKVTQTGLPEWIKSALFLHKRFIL